MSEAQSAQDGWEIPLDCELAASMFEAWGDSSSFDARGEMKPGERPVYIRSNLLPRSGGFTDQDVVDDAVRHCVICVIEDVDCDLLNDFRAAAAEESSTSL